MPQNVNKIHPCPICGKPDMCFSNDRGTDGIFRVCGRIRQDMVNGHDGRLYKRLPSKTHSTYSVYVDYEQDRIRAEARRKEWCIANGKKYVPKDGIPVCDSIGVTYEEVWTYDGSIISPLPHKVLDEVLSAWVKECLTLADCHYRLLMKEWRGNKEAAETIFRTWPIRTMPPDDEERRKAASYYHSHTGGPTRKVLTEGLLQICKRAGLPSPAGIPGIYQDKDGKWQISARSGILYPVYNVDGLLYRLRIGADTPNVQGKLSGQDGEYHFYGGCWWFDRRDKPMKEKSVLAWKYGNLHNLIELNWKGIPPGKPNGKYVNFSSYSEKKDYEKHVITNFYNNGCRSGSCISVYRPPNARKGIFWITEGEKKGMVIATILGVIVVCVPGVNSFRKLFEPVEGRRSIVDTLVAEGAVMAVVAYDADKATNEMVSKAEEELLKDLCSRLRFVGKAEWNKAFGKGLDDSLMDGVRPNVVPVYMK